MVICDTPFPLWQKTIHFLLIVALAAAGCFVFPPHFYLTLPITLIGYYGGIWVLNKVQKRTREPRYYIYCGRSQPGPEYIKGLRDMTD
jgi:hypothetical protein